MLQHAYIAAAGLFFLAAAGILLLPGCAVNGRPMRFDPHGAEAKLPKAKSWFIEGKGAGDVPISCSFVEFDERGDFLEFRQHLDCQAKIRELTQAGRLLLVIYCHGWKNNSQSGDVAEFNAFLSKLAAGEEIRRLGLRIHGVYLGWRGNALLPYVDSNSESYRQTLKDYGEPIVDAAFQRRAYWVGVVPETLTYWSRKNAAETRVSALPLARAIFTYAAAAKGYGTNTENRVFVMGHSFGALMLEKSLGQAMTGAITMEWADRKDEVAARRGLPFDMILFVNSAAPAIYAKEMRDFLKAHRSALGLAHDPGQDAPVIISLTSTADWATGVVHPIGNAVAPFQPSLQRQYTTGIFGQRQADGFYPTHKGIPQSEFYTKTPGHQPYLINHWIVKEDRALLPADTSPASLFSANLSPTAKDPDVFFTSKAKYPASAWRLTTQPQGKPVTLDGMTPSMADSDYWIISCGKELIGGHNDVWSPTTMEMYAGLFRAAERRRGGRPL